MPVDLLANPKSAPRDLLKSPPRDLLASKPKDRNLLGEGIKAAGKFAIDVGKETVAQLSDLMKVPAAVAGLPHLPWQSKLVTEDPSITFHLPEFTFGSKGFIPTNKEYTMRPFDLAIGALLVGHGVQGFKYGQSVNKYNNYLAKEFQSANVKSAVKENIEAFDKILSKQGITLPENMSTEDRVRVVLSQAERSPTLKGTINNLAAGKIKPVSPVSGEVIETTGRPVTTPPVAPKPPVLPIQTQPGEAIAPKTAIAPQVMPLVPITPQIKAETPVSAPIPPELEPLAIEARKYLTAEEFIKGYKQYSEAEKQAVNILNKYSDKNIDVYGSFATLKRRVGDRISGKKIPDLDVIIEDKSISDEIINLPTNKETIKKDIAYAKKFNQMVKKDEPERIIKNVYDQVGRLDIPEKYQNLSHKAIDAKINITFPDGHTAWYGIKPDGSLRRIEEALQKEQLQIGRKPIKQALEDFKKVAIPKQLTDFYAQATAPKEGGGISENQEIINQIKTIKDNVSKNIGENATSLLKSVGINNENDVAGVLSWQKMKRFNYSTEDNIKNIYNYFAKKQGSPLATDVRFGNDPDNPLKNVSIDVESGQFDNKLVEKTTKAYQFINKNIQEQLSAPAGEGKVAAPKVKVPKAKKNLTLLGRVMKVGINKKAVIEKFGKEWRQFKVLKTPGVVRESGRDPTEWFEEMVAEGNFSPNEWEGAKVGGSGPGEYFMSYLMENARNVEDSIGKVDDWVDKEYVKWLEKQKAEGLSNEDVTREQRGIEENIEEEISSEEIKKFLENSGEDIDEVIEERGAIQEEGREVQAQIPGTEPAMPTTGLKPPPQTDLFQEKGELFEQPKDLLSGRKGFINMAAFNPAHWDEIREFIEDDWLRVKRLIQKKGANVTETNNPYEAEIRYWGRVNTRMEEADEIITKIDKDILTTSKKIHLSDKVLTKEINDFLIARHAPERNAIHGENAAGITDQEAYQRRADIAGKPYAAEVERLANKIQELSNKTLDILLESEVVSKELYDKLRTMYKNHVPLNRVMSENDDIVEVLTRRGFAVQGAGLKRAKGSELEVSDILTNVVANYKSALVRSEKNILDNFTLRFARENDYFDGLFEEVKLPMMPVGTVEHREAVDAVFMNDLAKFAESLGATFQTKGMPGRTLGTYSEAGKLITRKFATPREVQSHETAHFFDHKYKLRQRFYKRGESKTMAEEMLKHMETRGESANRMKQTGERFADAFEWWLTHRDLAKRDLPLFSQEMKNIINDTPDLKPILKIEPTAGFSIEKLEQMVFARQKYATDPHILPLREKGNQVYLKINDPQLAMALRGVNRHKVEGLIRAVKVFTRFYSGLMTRFNPEFVASNKIRDIQEMAVYLASKNEIGFKGTVGAVSKDPQSIKDIIDYMRGKDTEGARLYKQMRMDGGTTGGLALSTKEQVEIDFEKIKRINRSSPRKVAQIIIKSVDKWNTIFEDSTRLSVYKQALKQGVTRNKAAVLAKESTVNFNKLGTGGPVINALYMFSNASVQGSAKLLRALRNPKVLGVVLTLMGGAVALIAEWNDKQDKDWREKVSKWDKLNGLNIVIPTDKGIKYVTVPIAWGLKPIKVMFEEVFDLAGGYNKSVSDAVGGVMTALMEGYNPAGGTDIVSAITPSILDVPVDVARNRSWTGGRIKPDWNNSDAESIKYFDNLKKKLSGQIFINATRDMGDKGIEISPADMNYAYESYIGGAGRFVNKVFNTIAGTPEGKRPVKEIPFVSRFYRDIPEEEIREYGEDFKDLRKKLRDQDKERFYFGQAAEVVYAGLKDLLPKRANENLYEIYQTNRPLYEKIRDIKKDETLKLTYTERLIGKLGVENGERAKYIWEKIDKLKTDRDKNAYLKSLYEKKILTDKVYQQLKRLKDKK